MLRTVACMSIVVVALGAAGAAHADTEPSPGFLVIVHPDNSIASADRKFLADVFLKKKTRWPDDSVIKPVDLDDASATRRRFSRDVLKRSVAAVRSYWRQLIYSGRGVPPPELDSDSAVVGYVRQHEAAIGYVTPGADLDGVKVVQVR
jgi:ABC-type phosphate transport system substrate-binding protein